MTDDHRNHTDRLRDDSAAPDPRALAMARALGRYQALRDIAAALEASHPDDRAMRLRASGVSAATRVLDLHSLAFPVGIQPGFFGRLAPSAAHPGLPRRR